MLFFLKNMDSLEFSIMESGAIMFFAFILKKKKPTFIKCLLYAKECVDDNTVEDKLSTLKGFINDIYVLQ